MRRLSLVSLIVVALVVGSQVSGQGKKTRPVAADDPKHDPARAVANLEVNPELEAQLVVSEPRITNPTNLDVDSRGRVWICDVVNYRGNNGKRPAGDRIMILDDIGPDGHAGKVTTFYQGRDVDTAMGICVLGDKVIVSATPNILVFTKDADDKIVKKEALFTKSGTPQHDHSLHSFVFGPDGKYYWNFGNTGISVNDRDGKPVRTVDGNVVNDKGKPYRQGMAFRCDPDGSNFEVLGNNFRNNYELAVDSFGAVWQSDNDDDGNRGVRINFVMEGGNFGYTDEMTGAGWQSKRTNMEKEIPLRHWHLNDPGVVPNLLQTGAGSPAGICLYEGTLLPPIFRGQIIHCDPGPSVCRAYIVTPKGAGYTASIVNILDGSKKNNWFRPVDVCTAPDGSLFITDWYDPGVGGHAQRDLDRGRVFRVAPKGSKYEVPKVDVTTIEGAAQALKSPNLTTRYLAYTKLHDSGDKAASALNALTKSTVPHERARAYWLLGQIPGMAQTTVDSALTDREPNVRIAGLRMAREWKLDMIPLVKKATGDVDFGVLREAAIALRHNKDPQMPQVWAGLAKRYDGKDRWYLEALGIGADRNWDACLAAFRDSTVEPKADRDLIWRSRGSRTPILLAELIAAKTTPATELPRLFRAFDFQPASAEKESVLLKLALGTAPEPGRSGVIVAESLARLSKLDVKSNPEALKAVSDMLDRTKGTPAFVEMLGRFNVPGHNAELLAMAQKTPNDQLGVDAMRLLVDRDLKLVKSALESKNLDSVASTLAALGNAANPKANDMLLAIVKDAKADLELRRQATRVLGKNRNGAVDLVNMERKKQLPKDLHAAASAVLHQATWKDVKTSANKLFPLPAAKDNATLPAIADLVKLKGDAIRGKDLFAKAGTCANCHIVNGAGKDVGPNLSEIGKKLSADALFESILYPSAGISHNYETWVVETKKGEVVQGLMVSQSPTEVIVKEATGLTKTLPRADVETMATSPISLMPADLTKNLSSQDLADVVGYLQTLKEVRKQ
jgi:putative membrane-bound dehydrogenase-like protein